MATPPRFDACHRFFEINELINIFLEYATPRALVNGQRVCKIWNAIIQESETLQQKLFLKPDQNPERSQVNPFIDQYFVPVLSLNGDSGDRMSSASDLRRLAWALDGTDIEAPRRRAFARREASWRRMLACQPPVDRLGWWHQWKTSPVPSEENEDSYADPFNVSKGWGHQDLSGKPVTMGMIWDMVEARISRGCRARVKYYRCGISNIEDPAILTIERAGQMAGPDGVYLSEVPRVMIHTAQVWSRRPTGHEQFSHKKSDWIVPKDVHRNKYNPLSGDGFNVLRADCLRDDGPARPAIPGPSSSGMRWSQSEDANSWSDNDGVIYYGIGASQAGRATAFRARPVARGRNQATVFEALT